MSAFTNNNTNMPNAVSANPNTHHETLGSKVKDTVLPGHKTDTKVESGANPLAHAPNHPRNPLSANDGRNPLTNHEVNPQGTTGTYNQGTLGNIAKNPHNPLSKTGGRNPMTGHDEGLPGVAGNTMAGAPTGTTGASGLGNNTKVGTTGPSVGTHDYENQAGRTGAGAGLGRTAGAGDYSTTPHHTTAGGVASDVAHNPHNPTSKVGDHNPMTGNNLTSSGRTTGPSSGLTGKTAGGLDSTSHGTSTTRTKHDSHVGVGATEGTGKDSGLGKVVEKAGEMLHAKGVEKKGHDMRVQAAHPELKEQKH